MKKIAIVIVLVGIALSYSCKKNDKVQTQISGTLMTNGTNDPVQLSTEVSNPSAILFHNGFNSGGVVAGETVAEEVARTTVDDNAHYSFDLELYENDEYFIGFEGIDESKYFPVQKWYPEDYKDYPVIPGTSNTVNPKAWAISWIRPRFINTNPDPNNNDVFYYTEGPSYIYETDILLTDITSYQHFFPLNGSIDTLAPWIHRSWSGQTGHLGYKHEVEAKLTRNGVTVDMVIPYFVPPFDTTIVEIRY